MDKRTDSGVSPVIGTFLLLALSVVMITLVTISVMGIMGSYTPVYERSVGFTIDVNASTNSAFITPVSGTDLPFLQSYDVYTDNGHWYSPSPGGINVTDFNSTVTFINIVGHFPEYVDALVFSGKVAVEGGVIVVVPVVNPYYAVNESYDSPGEFADSISDWYNQTYGTTTPVVIADSGSMVFYNDEPILIGGYPIEISDDSLEDIDNNFEITMKGTGSIKRAQDYTGPLFVIGTGGNRVIIKEGTITIDGDNVNTSAGSAAVVVKTGARLDIESGGFLIIQNNDNINISAPGGGLYNQGTVNIKQKLTSVGNSAYNGGGIYTSGSISVQSGGTLSVTNNHAVYYGGGVYREPPGGSCPSAGVLNNTAGNPLYQNNYP